MRDSESKKKGSKEVTPRAAIKALSRAMLETFQEQNQSDLDVFERYTYELRSKVQFRHEDFGLRFSKGYESLLRELRKRSHK